MPPLPELLCSIPRNDVPIPVEPFNLRKQYVPSIIFFPENVDEVAQIVSYAHSIGQRIAARCGGHSYASYSLGGENGSWVIDLRKFDKIKIHGETKKTASIGAGNSVGRIITELYSKGKKAFPSGLCFSVGIGGLTLHGGYNFTSRMWGLAIDAIEELKVVLANGEVVTATKHENADLFFALLGAGSSFGIVTKFKMRLEDAPDGIQYTLTWNGITEGQKRTRIFQAFQCFAKNYAPNNMSVRLKISQDKMEISGVYWICSPEPHFCYEEKLETEILPLMEDLKKGNILPTKRMFIKQLPWHKVSLYMANDECIDEEYRAITQRLDFATFASASLSTGMCPELLSYLKETEPTIAVLTKALPYPLTSEQLQFNKTAIATALASLPSTSNQTSQDVEICKKKCEDFLCIASSYQDVTSDTCFLTSLFLKDEVAVKNIEGLFDFINHPCPPPPECHTWYLFLDTWGGKDSQIPEGRNRQHSCFSFRDSLFVLKFDISTDTHMPPFNPEGIKFLHNLRNTLIDGSSTNPPPKMYYNFLDPESIGDEFWAYNYYDNETVGTNGMTIYKRLKELKKKYDPKYILWSPQCIGAEDLTTAEVE